MVVTRTTVLIGRSEVRVPASSHEPNPARRSVLRHIKDWRDSVPIGTKATVAEIANFVSEEYDGDASPGAVAARLFPSNGSTIPGIERCLDDGVRKVRTVRELREGEVDEVSDMPDELDNYDQLDDQGKLTFALDQVIWRRCDHATGYVSPDVMTEFVACIAPVLANGLAGVRVYLTEQMRAVLAGGDIVRANSISNVLRVLSYDAAPIVEVPVEPESDDDLPKTPPGFMVQHSQAFYVRVLLGRGLSGYLNDVQSMRAAAEEDDCPGIFKEQLKGAAAWCQQVLGESVEYIVDLPSEIRPDMKDYAHIKPFGPLVHPEDRNDTPA